MRKQLRLHACNRPGVTRQCLDHLARCRGLADWELVASIDNLRRDDYNWEVVDMLREFMALHRGTVQLAGDALGVRPHADHHKRINDHIRHSWTQAQRADVDLFFHLEDDVLLAPDALEFVLWAHAQWPYEYYICHGPQLPDPLTLEGINDGIRRWTGGKGPVLETWDGLRSLKDLTFQGTRFSAYGAMLPRAALDDVLGNWRTGWASWDEGISDSVTSGRAKSMAPVLTRARNIGQDPNSPLGRTLARPVWSGDLEE